MPKRTAAEGEGEARPAATVKRARPEPAAKLKKTTSSLLSSNWKQLQQKLVVTTKKSKKDEIWFDGVSKETILAARAQVDPKAAQELTEAKAPKGTLAAPRGGAEAGKYVALDCEMVGIGPGGKESALARVAIINFNGHVLLDTFVKPVEPVTDYRTQWSGVRPQDLKNAMPFKEAQAKVSDLIYNRILVGHALKNDLRALMLTHPKRLIRDTASYKPFRKLYNGRTPSLKNLTRDVLNATIQTGEHNPAEDARASLLLYKKVRDEWESKERAPRPLKTKGGQANKWGLVAEKENNSAEEKKNKKKQKKKGKPAKAGSESEEDGAYASDSE